MDRRSGSPGSPGARPRSLNENPVMPERDRQHRRHLANIIAMVIRNAMEDFHVEYLSDDQMRKLNPIIRNAVYTALQALHDAARSEHARQFLGVHAALIPSYWEP